MKVDADDCVSNRLGSFLEGRTDRRSWLFHKGYIYTEGASTCYLEQSRFYQRCGTSSILWEPDQNRLPKSMDQDRADFKFLSTPHDELMTSIRESGGEFGWLPFPGSVYCVGSGENWSGFSGVDDFRSLRWALKKFVNTRPLTLPLRMEFGL
jgi:hypothetical protein